MTSQGWTVLPEVSPESYLVLNGYKLEGRFNLILSMNGIRLAAHIQVGPGTGNRDYGKTKHSSSACSYRILQNNGRTQQCNCVLFPHTRFPVPVSLAAIGEDPTVTPATIGL